ncbi:MAG: hypothetical protein ACREKL_15015 [Chthoniobacterales bacterium]
MKLAKALKEKNRLAGETAQLKDLLKTQNCRPKKQPFDYDNREVFAKLNASIETLVAVKAAIAEANSEVYAKIFRLAEIKGLVALLKSLDTREGVFVEKGGYAEPSVEVAYRSQLGKVEVDRLASDYEAEIQRLQDELDEFNFTRSVKA